MNLTALFVELLKLSPFVAALFYFLITVWKSMNKKDELIMANQKEHSTQMLAYQEKAIMAQNNSADANRQLAGSIDKMRESQDDLRKDIKELKVAKRNGSPRPMPIHPSPTAAA